MLKVMFEKVCKKFVSNLCLVLLEGIVFLDFGIREEEKFFLGFLWVFVLIGFIVYL